MGWELLKDSFKSVVVFCTHFWTSRGVDTIEVKHLFYIMLNDESIRNILSHFNMDIEAVRNRLFPSIKEAYKDPSKPIFAKDMSDIINDNLIEARSKYGALIPNSITIIDIFMTMVRSDSCIVNHIFNENGISPDIVIEYIESDKFIYNNDSNTDENNDNDDINFDSILDEFTSSNLSGISDNKTTTATIEPVIPNKDNSKVNNSDNNRRNNNMNTMNNNENTETKTSSKVRTPALDTFCTNLVELATKCKIENVIGRDKEIRSLMEVLSRKTKPNALLLGEAGVGKSAIVEGLAIAIANNEVPYNLSNKRLMSLDVNSIVAGTELRGEFERRMKAIVDELKASPNTILFIDEFHNIMGAGNNTGRGDMGNVLKPALARGEIQVIGATTQDEYSKYILNDNALERRFQIIHVSEPTADMAIDILNGLKDSFEKFHNISITKSAIEAAVRYSTQYIPNRFLPDKCIDILDMAGAKTKLRSIDVPDDILNLRNKLKEVRKNKDNAARNQDRDLAASLYKDELSIVSDLKEMEDKFYNSLKNDPVVISEDEIGEVISSLTEIPANKITKDDSERLLNLESIISEKLIGQKDAISKVSKCIRRSRIGFNDSKKPFGSFMFMGPTGVGKTELARQLANELFGKDENLLKFDMSEYSEKYDVSKLLGSAPGFVGHEEGGKLTEAVRQHPYSIILFDEIEKAHKDIYNIMLQILEDGKVTDAKGRDVYFNNCIIIFTSNIGAQKAFSKETLGFGNVNKNNMIKEIMMKECEMHFRPEFLNRLDAIITFDQLTKDEISKIVDIQIAKVNNRFVHKNIIINIDNTMREHIINIGYNEKYGARPINRAINETIGDYMSDKMLRGEISDNMILTFKYINNSIDCDISINENVNNDISESSTNATTVTEEDISSSFCNSDPYMLKLFESINS